MIGEEIALDRAGMVPLPLRSLHLRADLQAAVLALFQQRLQDGFRIQYAIEDL